jgi:phenylacetic acid degradation operon negative regulatory protein
MTATGAALRLTRYQRVVTDAPVSYSVYSAFSFYGTRRGGELPGSWLVRALGVLGHEVAAVRQTLYRMEGSHELESRVADRAKFYRLTRAARAEAEAGLAKIMDHGDERWDGEWTFVHFQPGTESRVERERLRAVIQAEGFAALGPGVYVHPRDRSARLLAAAVGQGVRDLVEVFRGQRKLGDSDRAFVARHWRLKDIARRYHRFVRRYEQLQHPGPLSPARSFVLRFAVVFDYLETAWADPGFPRVLLPNAWPGYRAQRLARDLYRTLLTGALAFGDELMTRSLHLRWSSPRPSWPAEGAPNARGQAGQDQ